MSSTGIDSTASDTERATLQELARLGNLLRELRADVQDGALCGEPCDALDVMRALARIEQRLGDLFELRTA